MDRLALTLPANAGELPTSYVARLAARNFCDNIVSFCRDVGIDLGAISVGDEEAIKFVCRLSGIQDNALDGTTLKKTSTMKYALGSELLDTYTFFRGAPRICPQCVLEQYCKEGDLWNVVHSLHWQVPQILSCAKHDVALVTLGEKTNTPLRHDVTSAIRAHIPSLPSKITTHRADDFDHYLTKRVYGKTAGVWCDSLSIPPLWRCSLALGITLIHGIKKHRWELDEDEQRKATIVGFKLVRSGPSSIKRALADFSRKTERKLNRQPMPQYGEIQRLLGINRHYHDELEPMRKLMRDYVVKRYPLPEGYLIFGERLAERRIHSMQSACKKAKIRRELVVEMLIDRGIGERQQDGSFVLLQPLTVEIVESLKAEKGRFLSKNEAAKFLGATETMFKELYKAGVLQPRTGNGRWERKGFDKEFLSEFLDKVFSGAPLLRSMPKGAAPLPKATRFANCSSADILNLILDGKLVPSGRTTNHLSLKHLLIGIDDLKSAFPSAETNGFTANETARLLGVKLGTIRRLQELGHLAATRVKSSRTRITNDLICPAAVSKFQKRYFSFGMLRREYAHLGKVRRGDFEGYMQSPLLLESGMTPIYCRSELPENFENLVAQS